VGFHQLSEEQVGALFVKFQWDDWQARPVVEVLPVCAESGTANLELNCQVVRVELGWDNQVERADIHSLIHHCIVVVTALGQSIFYRMVLGASSLLLLWEAVETVDNSQVLHCHRNGDTVSIANIIEVDI